MIDFFFISNTYSTGFERICFRQFQTHAYVLDDYAVGRVCNQICNLKFKYELFHNKWKLINKLPLDLHN